MVAMALFVALLITGEIVVRMKDRLATPMTVPSNVPGLPYENTSNETITFNGISYRFNSFGLRGPEVSLEKPADTIRVLFLGDSVVLPYQVREEDSVSVQLEKMLNEGNPGKKYEVLNAAVRSYNLNEYWHYLKNKGLAFNPDVVIVGVCLFNDHMERDAAGTTVIDQTPREPLRALLYKSKFIFYLIGRYRLGQFISLRKEITSEDARELGRLYDDPLTPEAVLSMVRREHYAVSAVLLDSIKKMKNMESWRASDKYFKAFAEASRAQLFELHMVLFPLEFQIEKHYQDQEPSRTIRELTVHHGISTIDLKPIYQDYFEKNPKTRMYAQRGDMIHPGAVAHHVAAKAIAAAVLQ